MSGKIERAEKSSKLARDKLKISKDRDLPPELNLDALRVEGDSGKGISPRGGKKKRTEAAVPIGSPAVRFEALEERLFQREKIISRSSSAGPQSGGDPRSIRETEDADSLVLLFHEFVGQMTPSINNIVRRNLELKAQVASMLKAAQVEEAPYMAMARDKENLSREYDTLRYEHQLLQQELEQLKRDNALLTLENQQLQLENRRMKRKSGSVSSAGSGTGCGSTPSADMPLLPNTNGGLSLSLGSDHSSSNVSQTPPSRIKRRDNVVAELEQSILDLEEEIRSPRGILGSPKPASPELPPSESTPTKAKRKVTKSLSSDPQNSHTVTSTGSNTTVSSSPSSTRAKAPPERVISAPDQIKKTVHSNPASPSISTHNIVRQEARLVQNTVNSISSSPLASSAASPAVAHRPTTAEDREEQRLAKYMSGGTRRSTPNMISKLSGSKGTLPTTLTIAEQAAFSQLFRKWDARSDDQIERHELEIVLDQMSSNEVLKDLWAAAMPHISKANWDSMGISKLSTISLASALSFLADCKAGVSQPTLPGK